MLATITTLLPLLFLGLLILAAAVLKPLLKGAGAKADTGAYVANQAVLSPAERSFVGVLESVLPDQVGLLVKIRLGDVFSVRPGLAPAARTSAQNRINQKHVDFLLVRTTDLAPLAGIELDDQSHQRRDRQKRDAFVDAVFRSGALPLLHVPARAAYELTELRAQVAALVAPVPAAVGRAA